MDAGRRPPVSPSPALSSLARQHPANVLPAARYTVLVDRVRLGRALGYGTRHAAKTLTAVVEAATASSPEPGRTPGSAGSPQPRPAAQRVATRLPQPASVRLGARHFKRSFWHPLAVYSGALWLRVTGLFFALISITMLGGAWRLRATVHLGTAAGIPHRFWAYAIFGILFGYFAVSSFVRASLKERRAAAR